jgi:uncharacterized damage-inducible protein DinB
VPAHVPPAEMRASDADRERVVNVLRAAAADGRLAPEEFSQRARAAWSARTFGALALLTADLAERAQDVIRIGQRGGSVRRAGRWVVPRRLELRSSWSDVMLDFTGAVIRHDALRIDLNMRGGSLVLVAGTGMVVTADALVVRHGDVDISPSTGPGGPVTLRVQLAGRMRYGWVEARRLVRTRRGENQYAIRRRTPMMAGMSIDMFIEPEKDPRPEPPTRGAELDTLAGFLRWQRGTLELKCSGLDAAALARRSVEPSMMSLLGLLRHMADVERRWFRRVLAGQDATRRFSSRDDPDGAFEGARPDPAVVEEAWQAWRSEVAFAEEFTAVAGSLDMVGQVPDAWRGPVSLRWVLTHMIEEYARHNGHADLLRERIDGAVGQ